MVGGHMGHLQTVIQDHISTTAQIEARGARVAQGGYLVAATIRGQHTMADYAVNYANVDFKDRPASYWLIRKRAINPIFHTPAAMGYPVVKTHRRRPCRKDRAPLIGMIQSNAGRKAESVKEDSARKQRFR
jgi:hypothetical protein